MGVIIVSVKICLVIRFGLGPSTENPLEPPHNPTIKG